jgi:4-hydroxyphenylacetate 3-monooxygenase
MAVMFILPMDAPGVQAVLPRLLRADCQHESGSPFDYPLSSRFDENDAIFVLDNVLVPWEDVLVHRDVDRIRSFHPRSASSTATASRAAPATR